MTFRRRHCTGHVVVAFFWAYVCTPKGNGKNENEKHTIGKQKGSLTKDMKDTTPKSWQTWTFDTFSEDLERSFNVCRPRESHDSWMVVGPFVLCIILHHREKHRVQAQPRVVFSFHVVILPTSSLFDFVLTSPRNEMTSRLKVTLGTLILTLPTSDFTLNFHRCPLTMPKKLSDRHIFHVLTTTGSEVDEYSVLSCQTPSSSTDIQGHSPGGYANCYY